MEDTIPSSFQAANLIHQLGIDLVFGLKPKFDEFIVAPLPTDLGKHSAKNVG